MLFQNKKICIIEAEIEKLENKLAELEQEMTNPNVSSNSAKLNEICSKQAEINEKLYNKYAIDVNNLSIYASFLVYEF